MDMKSKVYDKTCPYVVLLVITFLLTGKPIPVERVQLASNCKHFITSLPLLIMQSFTETKRTNPSKKCPLLLKLLAITYREEWLN